MKITKTEIKNHIEERNPIATYYGGLAELGLEIYKTITTPDDDYVYFVEVAGMKETPKKSKVFTNNDGRSGFRWGHQIVWLDECLRTNW